MKQLGTAIAILTAITVIWVGSIFAQESKTKHNAQTMTPLLSTQDIRRSAKIDNSGDYYLVIDGEPLEISALGHTENGMPYHSKETPPSGKTEVDLVLPPGKHTVQLILLNKNTHKNNPPVILKPIAIYTKGVTLAASANKGN